MNTESTATLKRAVRAAVIAAGGPVAVAAGLRVSVATVARYGHPDHAELPPLASVPVIEAMGPSVLISEALAGLQGAALVPVDVPPDAATLLARAASVTHEAADVMTATAQAVADGVVTEADARRLAAELCGLMATAEHLLEMLKGKA